MRKRFVATGPWQTARRGYGLGLRMKLLLLVAAAAFCAVPVRAAFDVSRPPDARDLEEIRSMGWAAAADRIESLLVAAWKPSHFAQAGSAGNPAFRQWQLLQQWCRLLGTPEPEALRAFLGRRVLENPEMDNALLIIPPGIALPTDRTGRLLPTAREKLEGARVPPEILQALLPADYTTGEGLVADRAKEDFLLKLAGDPDFLREFFRMRSPDDFAPVALTRLEQLHNAQPGRWPAYRSLMIAFALVYDQREPADWPHHQVPADAVPRMTESLAERFEWFARANDAGKLDHDLRRLSAAELKFVVDAPVAAGELTWAAGNVRVRREQFDRAFSMVKYDERRVKQGVFTWPHGDYRMPNILLHGGICVDQAYFACIAGKARGIPTIFFAGQGVDGGHAWFGFLRGNGEWELDAGRYLNQNFTVGQALDPQTWLPITDHELKQLSGKTVRPALHDAAQGDLAMAAIFARRGDQAARLAAAESALYQSLAAEKQAAGIAPLVAPWEEKEQALEALGDREALRGHYLKAVDYFRGEQDFLARYRSRLADLERAGGNTALAGKLEDRVVRENRRERADLSTSAGAAALMRLVAEGDYVRADREFRSLLRSLGQRGGGNLFYEVVQPYVLGLRAAGREKDALRALKDARRAMAFDADSILEREFQKLETGG